MPYAETLRGAFKKCSITKIAIVDDAFDSPAISDLSAESVTAFRTILSELIEGEEEGSDLVVAQLHKIIGVSPEAIIARCTSDDTLFDNLWKSYKSAEKNTAIWKLLRKLFIPFVIDKDDGLNLLSDLIKLLESTCEITPTFLDGATTVDDVLDFDLIFLDFYLNNHSQDHLLGAVDVTVDGRKRSMDFLKSVVDKSSDRMPLVMLISSVATAEDIPDFRQHASMLASKMGFLPKGQVGTNLGRAQHAILGLVKHRDETDALWNLLSLWQKSVTLATAELMTLVRELDLADYSYLQHFRLNEEKVPLAHYLGWLFNGYLNALVEKQLHTEPARQLTNIISFTQPVPSRVSPTAAISSIYSGVTTSLVPTAGDGFKPRTWAGDIYIKTKTFNVIFEQKIKPKTHLKWPMPEVLVVINPSCDLIPDRENNVKTVTMIGGTLTPLETAKIYTNHLLVLNGKSFHIEWDTKWPVSAPLEEMNGATALGNNYRWVARLRDLYHTELQNLFVKDVGRIGVPIVPTMPVPVNLRVLARKPDKTYEVVFDRKTEKCCAWVILTKKGDKAVFIREEIVWDLQEWVKKLPEGQNDKITKKLRECVEQPAFIEKLQSPIVIKKDSLKIEKTGVLLKRVILIDKEFGEGLDDSFVFAVSGGENKTDNKTNI